MLSRSCFEGAEAVILSLLTRPAAKNPLANAVAIFPAPIKPIEEMFKDIAVFRLDMHVHHV